MRLWPYRVALPPTSSVVRSQHSGYEAELATIPPQQSAWGQLLRAATSFLIDQPRALPAEGYGFGGNIGAVFAIAAGSYPLTTEQSYSGDLPTDQQADVEVLPPWERV